ncbi:MAG: MFS transporter [Anaerolineae bacterium]|nr:MFS transporter [Anaerolineae bacterium]NUQ06047.1 MFS transporter [Anaerolineae bacterium]
MSQSLFARSLPVVALTFVDVLGLTIILPLLHLYAIQYDATPLQIGLTAAAFPLAQLIGVPVMGALSDRYGRKPLLLISQITTCIGFLMLAAATSLEMVLLSRIFDGLFGANLATAQAAITDLTDEKTRAQGLGLTGAAFGAGFLIGPAIALIALDFSKGLAMPALIAAAYSFVSILITFFGFKETLPPEKRGAPGHGAMRSLFTAGRMLRRPSVNALLILMFAQQFVFFAFESLLGLFLLNRLGLLGQGSALVFIYVGVILIAVQVRLIGRWTRKYGEARVMRLALTALGIGLLLVAATPAQPHPFYVEALTRYELRDLQPNATERVIGGIPVELPDETARGFGGILWLALAAVPLTVGAGLIRPTLNSLMVGRVGGGERGAILGVSASMVSLADASAPLVGGWLFQAYGSTMPFALGGAALLILAALSLLIVRKAGRGDSRSSRPR